MYRAPDFASAPLRDAPDARFEAAPGDGVLPDDFFATTNLPTYVRVDGEWLLPAAPRMDGAIVRGASGELNIVEGRYVRRGELVVVGHREDGSEGVFVHADAFGGDDDDAAEFRFMRSEVSREKPVDYAEMARLLCRERAAGHIVWVVGPAVLHARGRDAFVWFIENGFVHALLGGNAIAVHDIEQALMDTTLGMDGSGHPVRGGHAFHMRAINRIARAGSIRAAVETGVLTSGIMHACVRRDVPFVLAGSIRDDGPLPDTITDIITGQEHMRAHAQRATMTIMIATALHSIAFGNMLPAFVKDEDGLLRPLPTIAVDASEFVINKLKDRGTHQAFGVITNAQDFLHVLRHFVEQHAARDRAAAARDPSCMSAGA